MTTSREAFQTLYGSMGFDLTRQAIAVPESWAEYVSESTGFAWAGWQAATERAAKICDDGANHLYPLTYGDCAEAIRGES